MRMKEEQRKRDDERDKLFLLLMKDAFTSIHSTTAYPYTSSSAPNFPISLNVSAQPYGNPPPAASTQAPVPPIMDDFHTFSAADSEDYPLYTDGQDEVQSCIFI